MEMEMIGRVGHEEAVIVEASYPRFEYVSSKFEGTYEVNLDLGCVFPK
jgi:hypothetical protein